MNVRLAVLAALALALLCPRGRVAGTAITPNACLNSADAVDTYRQQSGTIIATSTLVADPDHPSTTEALAGQQVNLSAGTFDFEIPEYLIKDGYAVGLLHAGREHDRGQGVGRGEGDQHRRGRPADRPGHDPGDHDGDGGPRRRLLRELHAPRVHPPALPADHVDRDRRRHRLQPGGRGRDRDAAAQQPAAGCARWSAASSSRCSSTAAPP